MIEKPKIQYIGQFYVHGSAAQKLEPKKLLRKPKTQLPLFRPNRDVVVCVEPVAIVSMVLAVVLLVGMILGGLQLQEDWARYERMSSHLDVVMQENAKLRQGFREVYDMDAIRAKAMGLGMVGVDTIETKTITLTIPDRTPEPEPTWTEELSAFWKGLWA